MKTILPKIGLYAGSGTSHSWLWFVDLFENAGYYDLVFLDEFSVQNNEIASLDVLVISGGDTFAVAKSLGEKGGKNIKTFVERGGIYMGSCAGAYLPMKSSKKPLDLFNFVDVKITNLSKTLPIAEIKTCKFCTGYGCDFIFHPVREAVALKTTSFFDSFSNKGKSIEFTAPLYGGPGMDAKDPSWVLASYEEFTPKTSFLTSRKIARDTLINYGAVVRVPFSQGCFYLLGPHLEHPGFKQANQFIIDALVLEIARSASGFESKKIQDNTPSREKLRDGSKITSPNLLSPPPKRQGILKTEGKLIFEPTLTGKEAKDLLLSIKRELSNSRIVASSLEFLPVQWLIGQKVYEPQKVRVYLESMWKRLKFLEKNKTLILTPGLSDRIKTAVCQTTIELRRIKQQVDAKQDSLKTAIIIFDLLHTLSISFFDLYFATLSRGINPQKAFPKKKIKEKTRIKA